MIKAFLIVFGLLAFSFENAKAITEVEKFESLIAKARLSNFHAAWKLSFLIQDGARLVDRASWFINDSQQYTEATQYAANSKTYATEAKTIALSLSNPQMIAAAEKLLRVNGATQNILNHGWDLNGKVVNLANGNTLLVFKGLDGVSAIGVIYSSNNEITDVVIVGKINSTTNIIGNSVGENTIISSVCMGCGLLGGNVYYFNKDALGALGEGFNDPKPIFLRTEP